MVTPSCFKRWPSRSRSAQQTGSSRGSMYRLQLLVATRAARRTASCTPEKWHLNRLGQLAEFEQESNTESQQEGITDSHRVRNKAHAAQQPCPRGQQSAQGRPGIPTQFHFDSGTTTSSTGIGTASAQRCWHRSLATNPPKGYAPKQTRTSKPPTFSQRIPTHNQGQTQARQSRPAWITPPDTHGHAPCDQACPYTHALPAPHVPRA